MIAGFITLALITALLGWFLWPTLAWLYMHGLFVLGLTRRHLPKLIGAKLAINGARFLLGDAGCALLVFGFIGFLAWWYLPLSYWPGCGSAAGKLLKQAKHFITSFWGFTVALSVGVYLIMPVMTSGSVPCGTILYVMFWVVLGLLLTRLVLAMADETKE